MALPTAGTSRRVHLLVAGTAVTAFAATLVNVGVASAHPATGAAHAAASAATSHAAAQTRQVGLDDTSDSYVSFRHPTLRPGRSRELKAVDNRRDRKVVYVKFRIGSIPTGAEITGAAVDFTRAGRQLPAATLRLYRVRSTHWSQRRLDARNRPHGVYKVGGVRVAHNGRSVAFPVHTSLQAPHTYSFAVTSSARRAATRFKSRESGVGPKLKLQITLPAPTVPTPTTSPTATPSSTPTTPVSTPTSTPTTPVSTPTTPTSTPTTPVSTPTTPTSTPTTPVSTPTTPVSTPTTPVTTPTPPSTGSCTLSATLVPSCGVLFGGYLTSYGGASLDASFNNFNSQSGSQISVAHDYRRPGQILSDGDIAVAKTPGDLLLLNWKPANAWKDAAGGNTGVNSQIDAMANSIKSLGNTKIFLTIFHEPENDVSGGASSCPSTIYKGSAGTPADYRAMWANVEARFAALHVTNVVWTMNYMGYSGWNCMVDDLWPGNNLVDWVLWDPYALNNGTFTSSVTPFYNELTSLSDANHDYLSKPWGLGEFGDGAASDLSQETFYGAVSNALAANQFPRLKLLCFFDAVGPIADYRVAYNEAGIWDTKEVLDLAVLSNSPAVDAGRRSVTGA